MSVVQRSSTRLGRRRRPQRVQLLGFFLAILAMFSDGYDYVSIAYAARRCQRLGIAKATLGPVFSSGVVASSSGRIHGVLGDYAGDACSRSLHVLSRVRHSRNCFRSSVRAMIVWRS